MLLFRQNFKICWGGGDCVFKICKYVRKYAHFPTGSECHGKFEGMLVRLLFIEY
jgi:hypothetical protein